MRLASVKSTTHYLNIADSIADIGDGITLSQSCGAWINPETLKQSGYVDSNNQTTVEIKGFTCPLGQICVEATQNPQNGTQAFDNFFLASMQVVVVASVNTWAPVMYQMMDTDFYFSFAFFIVCVVVSLGLSIFFRRALIPSC